MPYNIEKFGTPEAMKKLDIDEGLFEYEEEQIEKQEEQLKKQQNFDKIIDSLRHFDDSELPNEKLNELNIKERGEVFDYWFNGNPQDAIYNMDKFGSLHSRFQIFVCSFI